MPLFHAKSILLEKANLESKGARRNLKRTMSSNAFFCEAVKDKTMFGENQSLKNKFRFVSQFKKLVGGPEFELISKIQFFLIVL